ncbi:MAG: hypothetical protein A2499_15325 [Stygiobacter sp. RIFOXYC12_FULL_38_8]|nr:MAG: hypothetical protein A2X62_13840 [Stygiobacter sp. GWC2_38_9]OGV09884.1 MAG: hypothetical protein A2237_07840 [Stygiobacter sp. RIFOXYA2_FULL_38_8]OGV15381.1 MAG: hypothetical protein A2440_08070 [Stygiobacter sp. RIFOXYC2_FULL_38_25]OGV27775.1 MAG: hypothetical protein A2499_15325 [Stygiobacter sp. RIFOXYC12_FULL_38_8]OGV79119.1 MAG: hypothetical protein A2X65_08520 [Stygiobacter sp. GWF2_38_21]
MKEVDKKRIRETFQKIHNGTSNQIVRVAEQLEKCEHLGDRRIAYIVHLYKDEANEIQINYDLLADGEILEDEN